ncbi:MAG: hypothetical protein IJO63_01900 [Bacilli bacterium]|nr:hypothetical protein [Bacilli bacterium]
MKNYFFKIIKSFILIFVVVICSSNNNMFETKVNNNNLNKAVNVSTMALKINEFNYDALYGAKDTYTGDLTGYVYNCPACTGHLACNSNYNIKDGTITYPDEDYGEVNIVASSVNLPCGTIIRFNSSRISDKPVIAVVMDRGVLGNAIDFLSESEEYAIKTVGRSTITYDVLRVGW